VTPRDHELPPDPFADDGVDDVFALERAEELARRGAQGYDPRWDDLGGEPTIDDFDEAAHELGTERDALARGDDEDATGPFTAMLPWVGTIGAFLVLALLLIYGVRWF